MLLKILLLLACVGHILCGITDCLLVYTPKGRLNLRKITYPEKMRKMFADMPLKTRCYLCFQVFQFFRLPYLDILVLVIEWLNIQMYIRLLCIYHQYYILCRQSHIVFFAEQSSVFTTDEARDVVLEFQKKTMITVYIGYIALIVFAAAFSLFNKAVIKINA